MKPRTEELLQEILQFAKKKTEALEFRRSVLEVEKPPDLQEFLAVGRIQRKFKELSATIRSVLPARETSVGSASRTRGSASRARFETRVDEWFEEADLDSEIDTCCD